MNNETIDTEQPILPLCSDLWMFFYDEFGLTLLEQELHEIINQVKKHIEQNEKD